MNRFPPTAAISSLIITVCITGGLRSLDPGPLFSARREAFLFFSGDRPCAFAFFGL